MSIVERMGVLEALVRAESYDERDGSVDLLWSTGAAVERYDWREGVRYVEELDVTPEAVATERLEAGLSLVDAHTTYTVRDVVGVSMPDTTRFDAEGVATRFKLSVAPEHEGIVANVRAGVLRAVSVGYRVLREERIAGVDGGLERRIARRWEPVEVSLVPVGADPGAHVRAMESRLQGAERRGGANNELEGGMGLTEAERAKIVQEAVAEASRGAVEAAAQAAAEAAVAATRADARRRSEIQRRAEALGMDVEAAEVREVLDGDDTPGAAALKLIDLRAAGKGVSSARPAFAHQFAAPGGEALDEHRTFHDGAVEALCHRADPTRFPLTDRGRSLAGATLPDLAKAVVQRAGEDAGFDRWANVQRALEIGRQRAALGMGVGDFSAILAEVPHKMMVKAYSEKQPEILDICTPMNIDDFETHRMVRLSGAPDLLPITDDAGEFKYGQLSDAEETIELGTRGRIVALRRHAIVNDKLAAFARIGLSYGFAARRFERSAIVGVLTGNAAMNEDGVALFHGDHLNVVSSGAPPSKAQFSAMRKLLARQKGLQGEDLDLEMGFILAPVTLEDEIETLISGAYVPDVAANTLTPKMRSWRGIYDQRFDSASETAYYGGAVTGTIDLIAVAWLSGRREPYTESRMGFEVDGIEVKCRHDFAAAAADFRGLVRNPGA